MSKSAKINEEISSEGDKISTNLDDSSITETLLGQGDAEGQKILRVRYDKEADKFHINIKDIAKKGLTLRKTKKKSAVFICFHLRSIWDAFTHRIATQTFFQKLCTTSISWDDFLDEETCSSWDKWCLAGQSDEGVYMPRNFLLPGFSKARLVWFLDASELAYSDDIRG